MSYNRLGPYGRHSPDEDEAYGAQSQNPFMDPRAGRSPSPGHPLESYALHDNPYTHDEPLHMPMGPGPRPGVSPMPGTPSDRLQSQPTFSVEHVPQTYGHSDSYDAQHPYHSSPPYQPAITPLEDVYGPPSGEQNTHYWQDEVDTHPILQQDSAYGPDPHQMPTPMLEEEMEMEMNAEQPQSGGGIRRWKTVKEVQLFNGNLVLDCPVPPRLLNQIQHAQPPERDEFTHMRYSAATCDPSEFYSERFTLRQKLFAKPRHTELFINIEYMNSRNSSKTWGKEAWKKIVVCVVSDGRAKINPRTRAVLAGLGVYQDGIAKQQVNGKDVTAHIYEYTTQMALELKKGVVSVKKGNTPVQMLFCLKEKNQKKINSHRWFFQAFGEVLDPNICVLIDAGTKPGKDSIYKLWKAFDLEPMCAGACGEIKAMLDHGKTLINPLVAAQNFEYKMSNILDKPLESAFGFISVLPGAFSAYRFMALQNDKTGQGPLEKYFAGEKMHGANAGIFTANMYLAEDRILCFELVSKRNCSWILQYVKSATGETDVPTEMADFILQRRRWLNGSFFAAVYALAHFHQIFRSNHSVGRNFMFMIEFFYQGISMLFAWFAISVQAQLKEHDHFTFSMLFTNSLFLTLIVSMASTYVLYFVASFMFLDPWHMFTSFFQYLLLTPTYINILNVYAFCNTHDITWGTKGDDKPEKLPSAVTKPGGKVDVTIPSDDHDLNSQYEEELRVFSTKWTPPEKAPSAAEKHEDYYKGFRSAVVLAWMFCNLALAAVVLNTGGLDRVSRSTIYMSVVLWSVAVLSAFRFIGACWFLVVRLIRGV
ncbi:unnamed protein product [Aureobasidium pullulans]|nr:unnamed protein product [Aureobasidium pullulans]